MISWKGTCSWFIHAHIDKPCLFRREEKQSKMHRMGTEGGRGGEEEGSKEEKSTHLKSSVYIFENSAMGYACLAQDSQTSTREIKTN